jgi:hypothetical protein
MAREADPAFFFAFPILSLGGGALGRGAQGEGCGGPISLSLRGEVGLRPSLGSHCLRLRDTSSPLLGRKEERERRLRRRRKDLSLPTTSALLSPKERDLSPLPSAPRSLRLRRNWKGRKGRTDLLQLRSPLQTQPPPARRAQVRPEVPGPPPLHQLPHSSSEHGGPSPSSGSPGKGREEH